MMRDLSSLQASYDAMHDVAVAATKLPEGITAEVGPSVGLKPRGNRAARRKEAAFTKSAKWTRILRNSHKAAVKKLNHLAAISADVEAAFAEDAPFGPSAPAQFAEWGPVPADHPWA